MCVAGRQEAEGVTSGLASRRSVLQGARQSSEDLEPVSVRRVVVATRGVKPAGTPGLHAPKFATEDTPVSRKSALDRLARPQQTGSPATSSMNTPAMAAKPRRANMEPYSTARSRTSSAQPSSSTQSSSAAAAAANAATERSQPATSPAAAPQAEQAPTAASDKRGRQRIHWQPPTQAQREEAVRESRLNVSKRKASESGVTAAESTAVPADDPSPPKRMKASTDVAAEQEQITEQPDVLDSVQPPSSSAVRPPDEAQANAANTELQPDESELDFARESMDQVDDQDATADEDFVDDFDDEAAMRELDALT